MILRDQLLDEDWLCTRPVRSRRSRNFADYINRVIYRGERFILVRGNKPVAELGPLLVGKRLGELPDLLDSLPRLSEVEAAEFAEAIVSARAMLSTINVRDSWAS